MIKKNQSKTAEEADKLLEKIEKLSNKNIYPEALEIAEKCESIYTNLKEKGKLNTTHFYLGEIHLYLSNFVKSLEYLSLVLTYFKKQKNYSEIAKVYNLLGQLYFRIQNFDNSVKCFQRSKQYYEKINDEEQKARLMSNLGIVYKEMGDYKSAKSCFSQSLEILKQKDDPNDLLPILNNLGAMESLLKNYDLALTKYKEVLDLSRQHRPESQLPIILSNIGSCYGKMGNVKMAEKYLFECNSLCEKYKNKNSLLQSYLGLAKTYELNKLFKKATEYFQRYNDLNQEILNQNIIHQSDKYQTQINKISAELETERKERKIEKLNYKLESYKRDLTTKAMVLAERKELLKEVYQTLLHSSTISDKEMRGLINKLKSNTSSKLDWEEFERWFNEVHTDFYKILKNIYPSLSLRDQKFCAFLKLKMQTKDIAALTHLNPRTIENYRTKLRSKLGLKPNQNLYEFLDGI